MREHKFATSENFAHLKEATNHSSDDQVASHCPVTQGTFDQQSLITGPRLALFHGLHRANDDIEIPSWSNSIEINKSPTLLRLLYCCKIPQVHNIFRKADFSGRKGHYQTCWRWITEIGTAATSQIGHKLNIGQFLTLEYSTPKWTKSTFLQQNSWHGCPMLGNTDQARYTAFPRVALPN